MEMGTTAERAGGQKRRDFDELILTHCPVTDIEAEEIERLAAELRIKNVRSVEVRDKLESPVLILQRGVVETIRRVAGREKVNCNNTQKRVHALWGTVLLGIRILKTIWADLTACPISVEGRFVYPSHIVDRLRFRWEILRNDYTKAWDVVRSEVTASHVKHQPSQAPEHNWCSDWDKWWKAVRCILFGHKDSMRRQVAVIGASVWSDFLCDFRRERRDLLRNGQHHMFLSKMNMKVKGGSGYKPSLYWDEKKGCSREPVTATESKEAADQQHKEVLGGDSKRAMLNCIRAYYDEVGNWTAEFVYPANPSADDLRIWEAISQMQSMQHELSGIGGPLEPEEFEHVLHMLSGKEPGPSHFEMVFVRFFGIEVQNAVFECLNAMICLALIPDKIKRVEIVHIEKQDGGSRPLSLFNELLKAAEGVVTRRILLIMRKLGSGKLVAESNFAYQPGRGCPMVISQDVAARADAIRNGQVLYRIAGDYDGWFDVLPREIAIATMKALEVVEVSEICFVWTQRFNAETSLGYWG